MSRAKSERRYSCFAVVEGYGIFPLDMLRYDCCFPVESEDANAVAGEPDAPTRRVAVQRWCDIADGRWTNGRWESFGWKIVSVTNGREYAIDARGRKPL